MEKFIKFANLNRKGVKTMKNLRTLLVLAICSMMAIGNAGAVTTVTTVTATINTTSTLTVAPSTIGFGTLGATSTQYRFTSPSVNVQFVAGGPYEIRVYTNNGVGNAYKPDGTNLDGRGFIRDGTAANADKLYLKAWCANFNANGSLPNGGSSSAVPVFSATSSQTDYLWKGYALGAAYDPNNPQPVTFTSNILESTFGEDLTGNGNITDMITASVASPVVLNQGSSFVAVKEVQMQTEGDTFAAAYTRCVLACNTTVRGDKSLGNSFWMEFGVDVSGVKNGTYSSSNNGTTPITTGQTCANGVIFELLLY